MRGPRSTIQSPRRLLSPPTDDSGNNGTPSARSQAGPTASHRSDRVAYRAKSARLSLSRGHFGELSGAIRRRNLRSKGVPFSDDQIFQGWSKGAGTCMASSIEKSSCSSQFLAVIRTVEACGKLANHKGNRIPASKWDEEKEKGQGPRQEAKEREATRHV